MVRRTLACLVIVTGGATSSGCNKLADAYAEKVTADALKARQEAEDRAEAAIDPDTKLADKLSGYIECLNGPSSDIASAKERYADWIEDLEVGPTGDEQQVGDIGTISGEKYCFQSIDEAKEKKPPLPEIEQAAEEYRQAVVALAPMLVTVHDYYDQKDYKDDGFAKGKQLHKQLMPLLKTFEKANESFDSKVIQLNEEVSARLLDKLKTDPERRLEYLARLSMSKAKVVLAASDVSKLENLGEDFPTKVNELSDAFGELETYMAQNPDAPNVKDVGSYVNEGKDLTKAAKALARRKRENKDFNTESLAQNAPDLVEGHPAQVIDKYNKVVRESNSLRF